MTKRDDEVTRRHFVAQTANRLVTDFKELPAGSLRARFRFLRTLAQILVETVCLAQIENLVAFRSATDHAVYPVAVDSRSREQDGVCHGVNKLQADDLPILA